MAHLELHDGVALLRMRYGKANAMSVESLESLHAALQAVPSHGARAVVLTGDGRAFSAGLALPTLLAHDRDTMRGFIGRFGAIMRAVFTCPVPVVAAIDGHAIAGGCVLALQADWRVMAAGSARIGLNETQLGIGLPTSVIEPLKLAIPPASYVPVALEGRLVPPDAALALGLVHEVVLPETLLQHALDKARTLGAIPPRAFAQVKAALRRPALMAWDTTGAEESERWLDTWFSPDGRQRLEAAVAAIQGRS